MSDFTFKEWPKIPRFIDSTVVFSEKLDGTNGQIMITPLSMENEEDDAPKPTITLNAIPYLVVAGSRNRWISPDDDNYGFAKWVRANQEPIIELLGVGTHYGEWWGKGIQRTYNMDKKVFSLFNVHRWGELANHDGESICDVVPFKTFEFQDFKAENEINTLDGIVKEAHAYFMKRSRAAERYGKEFGNPEGYVMFHDRSKQLFKFPINK